MARARKESVAQRERRLAELAETIDRDEQADIKARGRSVFANLERIECVIRQIKAARLKRNLSLADVAGGSGLDKAYLSRLENDRLPNPTLETVMRYAEGVGVEVRTIVVEKQIGHGKAA